VRIDQLSRSLFRLLKLIERLENKSPLVRSLENPLDAAYIQGKFTLQVS